MIDALTRITAYEYDFQNRRKRTIFPIPQGETVRTIHETAYDELGRRVGEAIGSSPGTSLALPGSSIETTNRFGYDAEGRLIAVTNAYGLPDQIFAEYEYDNAGNLIKQWDANRHLTEFDYNKLNRRVRRTLPDGSFELFFYDEVGNLITHTNFAYNASSLNAHITEIRYDALDRLAKKFERGQEATPWVRFSYTATGQRDTMTDASGVTDYGYDEYDRLQSKATPQGTLTYGYNENGNVTSMTSSTANGTSITYGWNVLNQLASVTDNRLASDDRQTTYGYDDVGNLKTVAYPKANGQTAPVLTTYNFNELNRLTFMTVDHGLSQLARFTYHHSAWSDGKLSPSGNRRRIDEIIGVNSEINRIVHYDYDALSRLTRERVLQGPATGTIVYDNEPGQDDPPGIGYDPVGNRRSRSVDNDNGLIASGITEFSGRKYDVNDRLDPDAVPDNPNPNYDRNGNTLLEDLPMAAIPPTAADQYDFENRLIRRTDSTRTVEILYDGDGHRVQKTLSEPSGGGTRVVTTFYLVEDRNPTGFAQVLEETTVVQEPGSPTITTNFFYTYGNDLISTTYHSTLEPDPVTRFYGYDGHGSVRFLVQANGAITDTYTYDAFGVLIDQRVRNSGGQLVALSAPDASAPAANPYRYAGEQWDPDLGLYYNRARYLNPNTGRFWTTDPFDGYQVDPLSLHKYLYAQTNPIMGWDPSGRVTLNSVMVSVATSLRVASSFASAAARQAAPLLRAYFSSTKMAKRAAFGAAFGLAIDEYAELYIDPTIDELQQLSNTLLSYPPTPDGKDPSAEAMKMAILAAQLQERLAMGAFTAPIRAQFPPYNWIRNILLAHDALAYIAVVESYIASQGALLGLDIQLDISEFKMLWLGAIRQLDPSGDVRTFRHAIEARRTMTMLAWLQIFLNWRNGLATTAQLQSSHWQTQQHSKRHMWSFRTGSFLAICSGLGFLPALGPLHTWQNHIGFLPIVALLAAIHTAAMTPRAEKQKLRFDKAWVGIGCGVLDAAFLLLFFQLFRLPFVVGNPNLEKSIFVAAGLLTFIVPPFLSIKVIGALLEYRLRHRSARDEASSR